MSVDSKPKSDKELSPSIWIVVAAYNEAARIKPTLGGLTSLGYNIVVVDDGSSDATAEVAKTSPVWVLRHPINCGQGAALQTGIDFALSRGAEAIVTFDGDGQHDPADLPQMLKPVLDEEVDIALGSRFLGRVENIPLARRALLRAAILFTRLTSGLKLTDTHNGFRVFSRKAAQAIRIRQPRMAHASEILDQIAARGLSYVEVPVTIRYTQETLEKGQSTWDAVRISGQLLAGRLWK
ncbi:MAG: glycosyltransferase family 2 protein [Planctomycetota bacterium]